MKSFIVLALCVAGALAAPPASSGNDKDAVVLSQKLNNIGVDGYESAYETSNGISAQEKGSVRGDALEVTGQFSYPGPAGETFSITYVANEDGFQPQGAHLP